MAIGTDNLAATPCCGVIRRNYEGWDSDRQEAVEPPDFASERAQFAQGICPDCGKSFEGWLRENGQETRDGWRWDYSAAERAHPS